MKKRKLSWLQTYEFGRDFRQGVIKDNLGLMTVVERKEIEKELLDNKKKRETRRLKVKYLKL